MDSDLVDISRCKKVQLATRFRGEMNCIRLKYAIAGGDLYLRLLQLSTKVNGIE